ncbi:MAG: MFS transporter [Armatimonadetes bacterium]|nr:MFS transporter [Armatimonadota bacterium]
MSRALRHPNFRLFFMGQGISLIGTWMQMIATSWLVYRLTNSAYWLGMSSFASRIPSVVLTPLAGVLVDRFNRQRIVIAAQVLAAVQAAILAALCLTHTVQVWHVIALGALLGVANAFDVPARQSFIVHLVEDRDDLSNAIALNSSMFNSARLIGPAVAGALTAAFGEGICFLLNALSYIAVIWALLAMKLPPQESKGNAGVPVLQGLAEGCRYAWSMQPIRILIGLIALASLMGTPYMVLLPKYAKEFLHSGPKGFGWLMGASGVGALCGAIYLAGRQSVVGLERLIPRATVAFSLGLIGLSFSRSFGLSWLLMVVTGGSMMVQMASCNTMLQAIVDDDKRGRVMSLYALSFMGTAPLGGLMAGQLGDRFGVPHTILFGGVVTLCVALVFLSQMTAFSAKVRPMFVNKGILRDTIAEEQSGG